mgnify:CR=1 FL=1
MGPIRVGPSSSHTAGAVRIGLITRHLLGSQPVSAQLLLHGSFAATGKGHGTDRALVAGLLDDCPPFRQSYIAYLSGRIHFLSRKVEGLTTPKVTGKLSRWLLESGRESVSCPATELSRRLDVSRASLYRAFEELERAGAIRRTGKTIVILDRRVLEIQNGGTRT